MIEIIKYTQANCQEWNTFVATSKNGNFIFDRNFMNYHEDRFVDNSLLFYVNSKLIALLPANIKNNTLYSHQGLTYGGIITDNSMKGSLMLELFVELKLYLKKCGLNTLVYKAIPFVYHTQPSGDDLYALTRMNATLSRRDLSTVIKLSSPLKLSSGRKDNIRKAKRAGVEVRASDDLSGFHQILTDVLSFHEAVPIHSLNELELLVSKFPSNIKLIGAFIDGELLAGCLLFDSEVVVHTQYMASSTDGRNYGALDLIIKTIIEKHQSSHDFLSFGPSTEDDGKFLNEGLLSQKEGFGGRNIVHDFYELKL